MSDKDLNNELDEKMNGESNDYPETEKLDGSQESQKNDLEVSEDVSAQSEEADPGSRHIEYEQNDRKA